METTTSFDLNQAIQRWRENLAQSPAFRRENLDELESHLRDSVASLQERDLSTEEAFLIATQRIGKDRALEREFSKVNAQSVWLERVLWMLIGIQVWGLVSGFVGSLSGGALSFGLVNGRFNFDTHGRAVPIFLFALVRLLAFISSLAICWWLIVRNGRRLGSKFERFLRQPAKLTAIGGALCVVTVAVSFVGYGSTILLLKLADMRTFAEVSVSMQYGNFYFGSMLQAIVLIALTLILARRHLRVSQA
jgi:hypothetical protein